MRETYHALGIEEEWRSDRSERELGDAIMESIAVMDVVGSSLPSSPHRDELRRVARRLAAAVGITLDDPTAAN